jgi:biotin-dependent carboxylase-like uncharacterized protein
MKLQVLSPGMLTTIQDLGRWGYQGKGMPVAGAMDGFSLQAGNLLLGNRRNLAALEITVLGPALCVKEGQGVICFSGAELDFHINNEKVPAWTALKVQEGDTISAGASAGKGARAYLCASGGFDVPLVMGSRSTYLRAGIGGLEGRPLKKGDILSTGPNDPLWERSEGFSCPHNLRPSYGRDEPLRAVMGPQDDLFTEQGIDTFLHSEYTISNNADRMGYRMDGPSIEHMEGADIVSDAIPPGSVQVPGHGQPIVMLADRQTTGGYTKIAVLVRSDIHSLSQKISGQKVHFRSVTFEEAVAIARKDEQKLQEINIARASYRSRCKVSVPAFSRGTWSMTINGNSHEISWEEIDEQKGE